ncbi:GNAT family N-acetyltransferase [Lipingzhangella sp. LS1_29]|uniref:GNAT family N-acetyltransferase n=1 Tax=Lipingzhangella rawalii TaxID=2055835 RepID=A0ABU2H798_9ACTN|nr:GNAT family N-acetyltransferase [Lipingzhangella rawalii]MDS1270720.1 GNAT family N-acetyltransferase [Lipingzhangella rawalii]
MFTMRPSTADDADSVARMIAARCTWMEQRGIESWRDSVDDLAAQAGNGYMWVLDHSGHIVGCTTVTTHAPPKDWTAAEAQQPSLYLFTTVTDPTYRAWKPGTLIAWWATNEAARQGRTWVRRGCFADRLVTYYQTQGFAVVKEQQRRAGHLYLLARRAERLDLDILH